jgi:hypothetical protein
MAKTLAMKAAYEILGYPTYHYVSMMENPPDIDLWLSLLESKYPISSSSSSSAKSPSLADFDSLLGHVSAVTDSPSNAFAPDLITAYPTAKVVLVERDVEPWFASFDKNVIGSFAAPLTRLMVFLDPGFIGKQGRIGQLLMRGQWCAESFGEWRANAREKYLEHNTTIKKMVPSERLLVYKLGSGWEPLCRFLGKDVPRGVEFPRVNETEELKERVFLCLMLGVKRAGLKYLRVLAWVLPVLVAAWYLRRDTVA